MAHLPKSPSMDHGTASFLWALTFGLIIWLGLLGIGVAGATSFIMAAVSGAGIYFFVRIYGEEDLER